MTDDLVKRLDARCNHAEWDPLCAEAKARIEALTAERDRLWGALNDLVTFLEGTGFTTRFCDAARAALKGQQP